MEKINATELETLRVCFPQMGVKGDVDEFIKEKLSSDKLKINSNGQVTVLDLSGNDLTGEIPKELGNLSALKELYLSGNQLTGQIPKELGNLSALEKLDLFFNKLTGEIPKELGNLSALTWLELRYNKLTGQIPKELGNLSALERLDLSGNQLTGQIPKELGNLSALTRLYLSFNKLTGEIPNELGNLSALKELDLRDNQLTGEIPKELGNLSALKELYLSGNQLTGQIPKELGNLNALETLRLSGNQLTGEIPKELGNLSAFKLEDLFGNHFDEGIPDEETLRVALPAMGVEGDVDEFIKKKLNDGELKINSNGQVTVLDLERNQLTGEIPKELGNLSALKVFWLCNNKLTGQIPKELGNLNALEKLDLSGNQLTGQIPKELGNLSALEMLDLSNNPELSGSLPLLSPSCRVYRENTQISAVSVRTKPLKSPLDYFMIAQYVILGYADLITDIIVIVTLINTDRVGLAAINIFFIVLGMFLGYWNTNRTLWDLFLNVTQLSILVDGFLTLKEGVQTEGLVKSKKMDAIVRSMPSVILQLFSVLIDLEKYPAGTYAYNTSIASIALGILGASVTLSGLHYKAGNRLLSWQFGVINLYYFSEILMRCVLVAIAFVSVQEYAFIAVGIDVFLRVLKVTKSRIEDIVRKIKSIDISMTCLYLGSDNALNNDKAWARGSLLTFIESLIFIIVMLTLDTDILHTLRTRQTAQHLCYVMLCSFFAKTGLYYYIEKKMESPKDDNVGTETQNEMHPV